MNASMRSRRDSTSGDGLKSIIWTLRHPAIPGEELAFGFEEPCELDLIDVWECALQDPRTLAPGDLRRDGQEELVGEPAFAEPAMKCGAALAEDGLDVAFLQQPGERPVELDPVRVADDGHRSGGLRRLLLRGGEDHDLATTIGEESRVPGQLEAIGDDHPERILGEAGALPV